VSWNPVFFRWHMASVGLIVIISLTILITVFKYMESRSLELKDYLC
jgi:tryptophan-rich sensory protein